MNFSSLQKHSTFAFFLLLICFSSCFAQEKHRVSLNGGYVMTTIEDHDTKASGWRITGLYEFKPADGKILHGLAFGFVNVTGNKEYVTNDSGVNVNQKADYKVSTIPVYYAPKMFFGSGENLKFFANLMIGVQFSTFELTNDDGRLKYTDNGFYGGGGAGINYDLEEKLFLNAGYEISYVSQGFYSDGIMHSVNVGIGLRF
jgi:hypothetical protein